MKKLIFIIYSFIIIDLLKNCVDPHTTNADWGQKMWRKANDFAKIEALRQQLAAAAAGVCVRAPRGQHA